MFFFFCFGSKKKTKTKTKKIDNVAIVSSPFFYPSWFLSLFFLLFSFFFIPLFLFSLTFPFFLENVNLRSKKKNFHFFLKYLKLKHFFLMKIKSKKNLEFSYYYYFFNTFKKIGRRHYSINSQKVSFFLFFLFFLFKGFFLSKLFLVFKIERYFFEDFSGQQGFVFICFFIFHLLKKKELFLEDSLRKKC